MTTIYVAKAFRLKHRDEQGNLVTRDFPVGNHNVPKAVLDHWYVQAHLGEQPPVDPDAKAVADELLAELEAKAKKLDEHAADLTDREQKLAARAKELDARDGEHVNRTRTLDEREAAIAEREKASEAAAKQQGGKK